MTLIKNFERFVNENLEQKFQVFENVAINGKWIGSYPSNSAATAEFDTWLTTSAAAQFRTFAALQRVSGNKLGQKENQASILFALLKRGQETKKGILGIGKVSDDDIAKKGFAALAAGTITLQMTEATVEYTPDEKDLRYAKTAGKFNTWGMLLTGPSYNQVASNPNYLVDFVNEYNTQALAKGEAQYVVSTRMKEDGYLDFLSAADKVDNTTLYLYANKVRDTEIAKKDTVETHFGGEPAETGKYGAEFEQGSAKINLSVQAQVDKAAEFVAAKFPAGSVPDKFQLTSGASTEWSGKNYPQTSGTGAVANPATDEQMNQDLAYRRGVAFAMALSAKLKEKGHPGIDGYVVNWAIGRSGQQANAADRFIDLEVKKNEVEPKKVVSTNVTTTGSKGVVSGQAKGQLFEFKLSMVSQAAPQYKSSEYGNLKENLEQPEVKSAIDGKKLNLKKLQDDSTEQYKILDTEFNKEYYRKHIGKTYSKEEFDKISKEGEHRDEVKNPDYEGEGDKTKEELYENKLRRY